MPIRPEQCRIQKDDERFRDACDIVDSLLQNADPDYSNRIIIQYNFIKLSHHLHDRFKKAYEDAGWIVELTDDQRDGCYWTFRPR